MELTLNEIIDEGIELQQLFHSLLLDNSKESFVESTIRNAAVIMDKETKSKKIMDIGDTLGHKSACSLRKTNEDCQNAISQSPHNSPIVKLSMEPQNSHYLEQDESNKQIPLPLNELSTTSSSTIDMPDLDFLTYLQKIFDARNPCDNGKIFPDGDNKLLDESHSQFPNTCNFVLNKRSQDIIQRNVVFQTKPDFIDRMHYFQSRHLQRRHDLKQQMVKKENESLKFTPTINNKSKHTSRSIGHLLKWQEAKQDKINCLRKAQEDKVTAKCLIRPTISKKSHELYRKAWEKDCAINSFPKVEDRLQLLGTLYNWRQQEKLKSLEKFSSPSNLVAPHSANLHRSNTAHKSIHERLYHGAVRKKLENLIENEGIFCNNGKEETLNRKKVAKTIDRLIKSGEEYKRKLERKKCLKDIKLAKELTQFTVTLKSQQLAAKRKNRTQTVVSNAIPKTEKSNNPPRTISTEKAAMLFEKQMMWKARIQKRLADKKIAKEANEFKLCTFQNPRYTAAWDSLRIAPSLTSEKVNHSLFVRSMEWKKKCIARIQNEITKSELDEMKECTFKPSIGECKNHFSYPLEHCRCEIVELSQHCS